MVNYPDLISVSNYLQGGSLFNHLCALSNATKCLGWIKLSFRTWRNIILQRQKEKYECFREILMNNEIKKHYSHIFYCKTRFWIIPHFILLNFPRHSFRDSKKKSYNILRVILKQWKDSRISNHSELLLGFPLSFSICNHFYCITVAKELKLFPISPPERSNKRYSKRLFILVTLEVMYTQAHDVLSKYPYWIKGTSRK